MTDPGFDPVLAAVIGLVFLLAGAVKGAIGLGLPTIAMGLLSTVMPPATAAALLIFPSTVTNIQQMRPAGTLPAILKRLWRMLAGLVLGTFLGAGWIGGGNTRIAAAALGAVLIVYALVGLSKLRLVIAPRHEGWLAPLVGLATGLVTAATGVFVIPAVPYMQAIGLEKDELVQALGLSFFVSTLALALTLTGSGFVGQGLALGSVATLVPALAGQFLGQALRARVDAARFRIWFFSGLLALGAYLLARNLPGLV